MKRNITAAIIALTIAFPNGVGGPVNIGFWAWLDRIAGNIGPGWPEIHPGTPPKRVTPPPG